MTDAELDRIRDLLRPVLGNEPCPECSDGRWLNGRDGICRTCLNASSLDVVDGISVEDAVRRVIEMVQHMPTNQDLLDAAVDAQSRTDKYAKMMLELEAERDAARAAVAREHTYAGELEGCLQSIATAVTGSPDTSGIVVRVEKLLAERDAARAAVAEMRERAAVAAEDQAWSGMDKLAMHRMRNITCRDIAAAIRAMPLPPSNEEPKR